MTTTTAQTLIDYMDTRQECEYLRYSCCLGESVITVVDLVGATNDDGYRFRVSVDYVIDRYVPTGKEVVELIQAMAGEESIRVRAYARFGTKTFDIRQGVR